MLDECVRGSDDVALDVEARPVEGRFKCRCPDWNWRRYTAASEFDDRRLDGLLSA